MKILIRNLARITTEAQIRSLFEAHGTVQSCTLVMDKESGASKGFGFIDMPKAGEAKIAIKNLNGKEIAENKIRVKKADSKSESESDSEENDNSAEAKPAIKESKAPFKGYGKVKNKSR